MWGNGEGCVAIAGMCTVNFVNIRYQVPSDITLSHSLGAQVESMMGKV